MSETTEQITEAQLAATIDHAILKPEFTRDDVDEQLTIARDWKVFSVCVRPSDIAHAVQFLEGSGVVSGSPPPPKMMIKRTFTVRNAC